MFLQTARAVLHNPNNPRTSVEVRVLFDSGSQKSYISDRARDLLYLDPIGEQSLSIATFGSRQGTTRVCPIVTVGMYLGGYPSMPLSLYVVPTINFVSRLLDSLCPHVLSITPTSWVWS